MTNTEDVGSGPQAQPVGYEDVRIEKAQGVCSACESYAARHSSKPVALLSCEGACLRGEVARQAANLVCHSLAPERTARVCLGGAFTKDTGQRHLVRNASLVIAVEGCFLACASRMMRGVIPELEPTVVVADRLYEFDRSLFGIDEMTPEEIHAHAGHVAHAVTRLLPERSLR